MSLLSMDTEALNAHISDEEFDVDDGFPPSTVKDVRKSLPPEECSGSVFSARSLQ